MPESLLRRVQQATYDGWRAEAAVHPGGEIAEIDGLLCHTTGIPVPQWNGVHVLRLPTDPVTALRASMAWFTERKLAYAILVPVQWEPALAAACGAVGLGLVKLQRQMALHAVDFTPVPVPPELSVGEAKTVTGGVAAIVALAEECFGDPPDETRRFVTPYVQAPEWTLLIGSVDGRPVSTATVLRMPGALGIYGVATTAGYRRRGYGAGLTSAALLRGFADLAVEPAGPEPFAHLNPSEAAEGVYARMGFHPLPGWAIWAPTEGPA